jgi:hypothetical protein
MSVVGLVKVTSLRLYFPKIILTSIPSYSSTGFEWQLRQNAIQAECDKWPELFEARSNDASKS